MKNRSCKYYEALDCISHKCEGCNRDYIYNDNLEAKTIDKRVVVLGVVLVLCFAFFVRG